MRWLILLLGFAGQARAEPARGNVVWYRAADDCPNGAEFLAKLGPRASLARLAEATDHIDFVVTLLASDGTTVGRLERQTQGGTVAIRELRDPSCQRVADALALSLSLALDPGETAPSTGAGAPAAPAPPVSPPVDDAPSAAPPGAPTPLPLTPALPAQLPDARPAARHTPWLGASGGLMYGVSAAPFTRAELFLDLEQPLPALGWPHAVRAGVLGGLGSSSTQLELVKQWLVAAELEACPWLLRGRRGYVAPCAGFELGEIGAAGERSSALRARSLWAAPAALVRGALAPLDRLRLELGVGALVPLRRNALYAGSRPLYRPEIIALTAELGVSFTWH